MCGVFGFASTDKPVDLDRLKIIALATETRGKHAHGLAWFEGGRLRRYKSSGPISRNLDCLELVRHATMIIGHCRYATNGSWQENENNHPHPCDGGWIVHNGIVHNHRFLASSNGLAASSECDTEVLGLLIESAHGRTLADRCRWAIDRSDGPLVMLGLWSRPLRLVIARRGNPLNISHDESGSLYFASLPGGLRSPASVIDNSIRVLTAGETIQTVRKELQPCPGSPRKLRPMQSSAPARAGRQLWAFE